MATTNITVEGMSCGGCEKNISKALLMRDGVNTVDASHSAGTVEIDFDDSKIQQHELAAAIEAAGFDVAA